MAESTFVRLFGFVTALIGLAGTLLAWRSGATLFVPFGLVLVVTGGLVAGYGWHARYGAPS